MGAFNINVIVCLLICCAFNYSTAQTAKPKIFEVIKYGAKGDGVTDDYRAIQNCINEALKIHSSKIIFGPGTYRVSKGLIAQYIDNDLEITGVVQGKKFPTIACSAPVSVLAVRGYLEPKSLGNITLTKMNIKGYFDKFPYSASNPFVRKPIWYYGLSITDKRKAVLDQVNISNIYGQGIYISTTQQLNIPLESRFQNVVVTNCKINNCWGYNPKADDYGDGIYISNVSSGLIKNNIINNNFFQTKQLGRCGIVIEFMAEKCIISNNQIFGYDRGIHIEADYGDHTVEKNKIFGSDMGIVLSNQFINGHNSPVRILNNLISNQGLPKSNNLKRTRDITTVSDRSLLNFVAEKGARGGSIISGNTLIIYGNYDYFSNAIVNIKSDELLITDNEYRVIKSNLLSHPIKFFNYSNSLPTNDTFSGVSIIQFKKNRVKTKLFIEKNNKMNGTKIELN